MSRLKGVLNIDKELSKLTYEKQCNTCGAIKKKSEFYFAPYGDGYAGECKECKNKRTRNYYNDNRELVLSKMRSKKKGGGHTDPIKELDKMFKKVGLDWLSWLRKKHLEKWGDWHEKYCK